LKNTDAVIPAQATI